MVILSPRRAIGADSTISKNETESLNEILKHNIKKRCQENLKKNWGIYSEERWKQPSERSHIKKSEQLILINKLIGSNINYKK